MESQSYRCLTAALNNTYRSMILLTNEGIMHFVGDVNRLHCARDDQAAARGGPLNWWSYDRCQWTSSKEGTFLTLCVIQEDHYHCHCPYGTCALYSAVISGLGIFVTQCHRQEHPLQWAVQVATSFCDIDVLRSRNLRPSGENFQPWRHLHASPQGTHDWWCVMWLGVCKMQCCFVDIGSLLSSFAINMRWWR